jgi:hypothetical protein
MGLVVNSTLRPLYPRERPGAHCIGSCMRTRAGLDRYGESRHHRDFFNESFIWSFILVHIILFLSYEVNMPLWDSLCNFSLGVEASVLKAFLLFFFIAYGQSTFGACAIVGVLFCGFLHYF